MVASPPSRAPVVLVAAALLGGAAGCKKAKGLPVAGPVAPSEVVERLSAREVPTRAQARLSVKLGSETMKIKAPPLGGGLVVDRPGRAHLAVLNPVGGPVLTLTSDGEAIGMMNAPDRIWVRLDDADAVLGEATEGAVAVEDLVDLLVGLVPVGRARLTDEAVVPATDDLGPGARLVYAAPGGVTVDAVLDPTLATPRRVDVHDAKGERLVEAVYEPFAEIEGHWLPTRVALDVVPIDLQVDLRYKSWKFPDAAPDVFGLVPPDGFAILTMDEYAAAMKEALPPADGADEGE